MPIKPRANKARSFAAQRAAPIRAALVLTAALLALPCDAAKPAPKPQTKHQKQTVKKPAAPARKAAPSAKNTKQPPASKARTKAVVGTAAAVAAPEIAEKQADLSELRSRIDALQKDLSASESHRADAADRLRQSERQISNLQRELLRLTQQQGALQNTLKELARQSEELGSTLNQQQAHLEQLVYRQYVQGNPGSLQLLLNGDNPNQVARDLHYLSAVAHARAEMLTEIRSTLKKKQVLADNARDRAQELADVEAEQRDRQADLLQQREERKALLAEIAGRISTQRKEIGSLQQDEKRMTQLIDRLSKVLAAQAAQAAQAARVKPRPTPDEGSGKPRDIASREAGKPAPVEGENSHQPEATRGNFAQQKGNLRLPAKGTVVGRFGAPREGGTWKGLFIRAGNGSDVKTIANGRVVFADWMRGFGNLLIVDHGDGYLSIYGNNDSLLKQVGDSVRGGETIASVGNSGGNPESGLYFELRHQGQAIDPMKWASLK